MFRGVLGFRGRPASLEFSYERTHHGGDFFGENVPAVFQAINIDLHAFFLTRTRVQPYVMAGLAFPWLTIEDGSFSDDTPEALIGDGVWRGQGLNLGGGVTVFAHPRAGVRVGYAYRVLWFNRERGVSGTVFRLIPRFRESSGGPEIMAFFTF
jgi:opacity protein-like surface antigen